MITFFALVLVLLFAGVFSRELSTLCARQVSLPTVAMPARDSRGRFVSRQVVAAPVDAGEDLPTWWDLAAGLRFPSARVEVICG